MIKDKITSHRVQQTVCSCSKEQQACTEDICTPSMLILVQILSVFDMKWQLLSCISYTDLKEIMTAFLERWYVDCVTCFLEVYNSQCR